MRVYARPGWRLARQVGSDVFVLAWAVLWAVAARGLYHAIGLLAVPARESGRTARSLADQMRQAGDRVGQVPAVGSHLQEPFGEMSSQLGSLAHQADAQVSAVHHLAVVGAVLCFLVPVLGVLWFWLPRRVRFIRTAAATRRFLDSDEDLELFALRAMAHQPLEVLARISPDPVGRWRAGDREVIRALAARELEATGLALPRPVAPEIDGRRRGRGAHPA